MLQKTSAVRKSFEESLRDSSGTEKFYDMLKRLPLREKRLPLRESLSKNRFAILPEQRDFTIC